MTDRTQTQVLYSAEQTRRFKALQTLHSNEMVSGTPQPRKASEVIDLMLDALEKSVDQGQINES